MTSEHTWFYKRRLHDPIQRSATELDLNVVLCLLNISVKQVRQHEGKSQNLWCIVKLYCKKILIPVAMKLNNLFIDGIGL